VGGKGGGDRQGCGPSAETHIINNVTVTRVTCPKQIKNHPDTENGHGHEAKGFYLWKRG
jgi:hypothetical protein